MKHIHLIGLPRSGTTYLFQLGRVAITHLQDEMQANDTRHNKHISYRQ
jgi:hypothetical protein